LETPFVSYAMTSALLSVWPNVVQKVLQTCFADSLSGSKDNSRRDIVADKIDNPLYFSASKLPPRESEG